MTLRLGVLASGSRGNALVVEANGTLVLLDCGISYRRLSSRMTELGFAAERLEAVLLTHEHTDHVSGLEVLRRRHRRLELHATKGTAAAAGLDAAQLVAGRELRCGELAVMPFGTSHDAAEPVGFVLEHRGARVGLLTDSGQVTAPMIEALRGCSVLLLECNHDHEMLRLGSYPWPLKQRILSARGHLSNDQAAAALEVLLHDRLELVVAMHLSQENNAPVLARAALGRLLAGSSVNVLSAHQEQPLEIVAGDGVQGKLPW